MSCGFAMVVGDDGRSESRTAGDARGALKQPRWCSGVASVDSVSVVVTVPKLKPRGGLFGRRFFLCLLRTV